MIYLISLYKIQKSLTMKNAKLSVKIKPKNVHPIDMILTYTFHTWDPILISVYVYTKVY